MNTKFSVRDVIDSSVQDAHCVYARLFGHIPGMVVSYFVVNFSKLTADMLTYLGAMFAIFSAFDVLRGDITSAGLWFYCAFICDFADGKVARLKKSSSHYGKKLDLAFDRLIFCGLTLTYLYYFEANGMPQEKVLLVVYAMVFLTYDVLELTYSLVEHRETLDELRKENTVNFSSHNASQSSYFGALKSIKTWIPSRVGSVGLVFIAAPITSFYVLYVVSLTSISIRLLWFLRTYFKK